MRRISALLLAALLTACSGAEPPEGALTADEERQLDEAAEMLDATENETGE